MLIGLIGAPNAGKDVIAEYFVKHKGFKKLAFADKVKEGYFAETGITEEQFKQSRGTKLEQEIRNGLWEYSEKICVQKGRRHFIWRVVEQIESWGNNIVITDIRRELELSVMEDCGANIMFVLRNFKEELEGKVLPGTKLPLSKIIFYNKFWNIHDNLETTYKELDEFYRKIEETSKQCLL